MTLKPLQVNLTKDTHEELERIKKEKGLSKSEIGRRGVLEQLDELKGDN
jgi:hypothetical protein